MTQEDEELYRANNFCRFCSKKFESERVRGHCHITLKNRGPAHNKYNITVTQKPSNFIPIKFHIFTSYNCHLLFEKLADGKIDKEYFALKLRQKKNIFQ